MCYFCNQILRMKFPSLMETCTCFWHVTLDSEYWLREARSLFQPKRDYFSFFSWYLIRKKNVVHKCKSWDFFLFMNGRIPLLIEIASSPKERSVYNL